MDTPSALIEAVQCAARQHPDDIDAAAAAVEEAARRMPEFEGFLFAGFPGELVRRALRQMVCDARHAHNTAIRAAAGWYGGPAKVRVGESAAVAAVCQSVYDQSIGGKSLGSVLGEELAGLAAAEERIADGHLCNVRLLRSLIPLVPEGKTVRAAVSERKLQRLKDRARGGDEPLAMAGH